MAQDKNKIQPQDPTGGKTNQTSSNPSTPPTVVVSQTLFNGAQTNQASGVVKGYYVIIGCGTAAVVNHTTLRQTKAGLKRLADPRDPKGETLLPVMHVGFKDPWFEYFTHGMGQPPYLLQLPGYEKKPDQQADVFHANPGCRSDRFAQCTQNEWDRLWAKYHDQETAKSRFEHKEAWVVLVESKETANAGGTAAAERKILTERLSKEGLDVSAKLKEAYNFEKDGTPPYRILVVIPDNSSGKVEPKLDFVYAFKIDVCTGAGRPRVPDKPPGLDEARSKLWIPPSMWDDATKKRRLVTGPEALIKQTVWNKDTDRVYVNGSGGIGLNMIERAEGEGCYADWLTGTTLHGSFNLPRNDPVLKRPSLVNTGTQEELATALKAEIHKVEDLVAPWLTAERTNAPFTSQDDLKQRLLKKQGDMAGQPGADLFGLIANSERVLAKLYPPTDQIKVNSADKEGLSSLLKKLLNSSEPNIDILVAPWLISARGAGGFTSREALKSALLLKKTEVETQRRAGADLLMRIANSPAVLLGLYPDIVNAFLETELATLLKAEIHQVDDLLVPWLIDERGKGPFAGRDQLKQRLLQKQGDMAGQLGADLFGLLANSDKLLGQLYAQTAGVQLKAGESGVRNPATLAANNTKYVLIPADAKWRFGEYSALKGVEKKSDCVHLVLETSTGERADLRERPIVAGEGGYQKQPKPPQPAQKQPAPPRPPAKIRDCYEREIALKDGAFPLSEQDKKDHEKLKQVAGAEEQVKKAVYDRLCIVTGIDYDELGSVPMVLAGFDLKGLYETEKGGKTDRWVGFQDGPGYIRVLGAAAQSDNPNFPIQNADKGITKEYFDGLPMSAVPPGFIYSGVNIALANGWFEPYNTNANTATVAELTKYLEGKGASTDNAKEIALAVVKHRRPRNGYADVAEVVAALEKDPKVPSIADWKNIVNTLVVGYPAAKNLLD